MKQEVRRGRKFIEYHDPDTQDEFTFTQEISGADVSYQETDGSWHPADENWATDGVGGFVLKNDKLNHKIRLKGNGGRTWYPRRNVNTEYMTFGVPQYRNGNKWSNFSFSGWSVEGKTITLQTRQGVTILVHSRWNGIKIDWVLANTSAPSRMRYPVALTGITEIAGVLFGADGTELGRLTPTTATDANGAELVCSGSFASGYVEFQADVTGASFPVTIDPDFTAANADCSIQGMTTEANYSLARSTSTGYNTGGATTYVQIGQDTYGTVGFKVARAFLLFDTSSIGSSSTVTQVNLTCHVQNESVPSGHFQAQIVKQDWSAYAADLTNATNRETAYDGCLAGTADDAILYDTETQAAGGARTSGNLSTAWVSKTGVTYYSVRSSRDYGNNSPTGDEFIEIGTSENSIEARRPKLTVTYTAAATGALRRTNMNAQMQSLTGGFN